MRREYKDCDDGEKLKEKVNDRCMEFKEISPGGREMATSGREREEHQAWTQLLDFLRPLKLFTVWQRTNSNLSLVLLLITIHVITNPKIVLP